MTVTEIDNVFHCDCGFSWQRGKSGAHDCAVGLRAQRDQLAAENAYLLNGAAAELNGSWVRHKTVLGAQAALLCIMQSDIRGAREWLEGTVDEVGADMPDDMTVAGLQAWFDSQMVAVDGKSGFLTRRQAEDAIRARIPATDAWQREMMAKGVEIFSEQQRSYIGKPSKNDAASSYCSREALKFATQIRQGELS